MIATLFVVALLPSAGLPWPPTELRNEILAGYEYKPSVWSGRFLFRADGVYEHRSVSANRIYDGTWEIKQGVLFVYENQIEWGGAPYIQTYEMHLRPSPRWSANHELVGCSSHADIRYKLTLKRMKRINSVMVNRSR